MVMNQVHSSRISTALWNIGFAYKKMLLHQFGWLGRTTVWDRLVFARIQKKLGGNLEAIVVGSARVLLMDTTIGVKLT